VTNDDVEAVDLSLAEVVERLSREVAALRSDVTRLDADLDESRRLNLRAAELLDIIYQKASPAPPPDSTARVA